MPNDRCKQLFSNVNEGMICIDTDANTPDGENVGVCSGDSGGPLNLQEEPGQYMTVRNASSGQIPPSPIQGGLSEQQQSLLT